MCVSVYVSVRNMHGLLDLSYIIFIDSSSSTGVALSLTVGVKYVHVSQVTDTFRDKVPKCIVQWRHLLDTTVFFYPIFDHHIYTGQIRYILDTTFGCNIASTLSHSSKCRTVSIFLYIFFAMMLYNNALNMRAGIGVFYQL